MRGKNKIIILILTLLVLGLLGYILYDKVSSDSDNKETVSVKKIADVVGEYKYETSYDDEYDEKVVYSLHLYENGLFSYRYTRFAPQGIIGNYVLEDNKILLNFLFNTGSDVSLFPIKGMRTFTITDDGKIKGEVTSFSPSGKIDDKHEELITFEKNTESTDSTTSIDLKNRVTLALCNGSEREYCQNATPNMITSEN